VARATSVAERNFILLPDVEGAKGEVYEGAGESVE
jgi:hypothetical protein